MVGIDAIGTYLPGRYVDAQELAGYRGSRYIGLPQKLGKRKIAVPSWFEDAASMAANATRNLLDLSGVSAHEISRVIAVTETPIDQSRPISAPLHRLLGLRPETGHCEAKFACSSVNSALEYAASLVESGFVRDKVLIVASDISRYERDTPAEFTEGAGAVAVLFGKDPRLIELDSTFTFYTGDVQDYWRPLGGEEAKTHGKFSLQSYVKMVLEAYRQSGDRLKYLDHLVFHTPHSLMVRKAFEALLNEERVEGDRDELFELMVSPSLQIPSEVGNIYTGSMLLALASLFEAGKLLPDQRIGFFGYGSSAQGSFFSGLTKEGVVDMGFGLTEELSRRRKITPEEFDKIKRGEQEKYKATIEPTTADGLKFSLCGECSVQLSNVKGLDNCPEGHKVKNEVFMPEVGKIIKTEKGTPNISAGEVPVDDMYPEGTFVESISGVIDQREGYRFYGNGYREVLR